MRYGFLIVLVLCLVGCHCPDREHRHRQAYEERRAEWQRQIESGERVQCFWSLSGTRRTTAHERELTENIRLQNELLRKQLKRTNMQKGYLVTTTYWYSGDAVAGTSVSPIYATREAARQYLKDAVASSKCDGVLSDLHEFDESEWRIERHNDYRSYVNENNGRWICLEVQRVYVHDLTNAEGE